MKNRVFKLFVILSFPVIAGALILSSCSKEGPAGVDGDVTCIVCHNTTNMDQINASFDTSIHGIGPTAARGASVGCAKCHAHQGFVETVATGRDTSAASIAIPLAFTCETCHAGHVSFDFENDGQDYALRTTEPVPLIMDGRTTVIDLGNNGNLCLNCHQPRRAAPTADAEGNYNITSSHYGPHHGPQGTILAGVGGYEFAGSEAYPTTNSAHMNTGCSTCHMADVVGDTGGHTFFPNVTGCTDCHADATSMDIGGKMTEMEDLLNELALLLVDKGVLAGEVGAYHVVTGVFPVDVAAAFYNWDMVYEDRSEGVHNIAYTFALIQNSIEAMQ
ncbi:hypothetical protein ACFLRG_01830 [Bacteroidota bacterium]